MLNDRIYKYSYEGPVRSFDCLLSSRWKGETYAASEGKARSNLIYRYKKDRGLDVSSKITLVNDIKLIG